MSPWDTGILSEVRGVVLVVGEELYLKQKKKVGGESIEWGEWTRTEGPYVTREPWR